MSKYHDGQKLKAIHFANGEVIWVGTSAESIEIVMEPGLHCDIPHVLVTAYDGVVSKWCVHALEGCVLLPEQEASSDE